MDSDVTMFGRARRLILGMLAVLAALVAVTQTSDAHPHVWVISKSEIVYAPDGTITGIRHAWTFDEMFSTMAVQGLETKTKGVYSREELAALAETNVTSLKEFDFFTFAKLDGKKEKFGDPKDYYLEYKDQTLVLHFVLPFKVPVKGRELMLEVYDPSYFVEFQMDEKDPVTLAGAPASCKVKVEKPSDNAAEKQKLTEKMFQSGDNSNYGAIHSSKALVTCS